MTTKNQPITALRILIIIFAVASAMIHAYLNVQMGRFDLMFTLNALGYLGLTGAYLLPLPFFQKMHSLVGWFFIGFTAVTILAWVILGHPYTVLGYTDKGIEMVLITMLVMDKKTSQTSK